MTIPADINSVSELISSVIKCFRALPHIKHLEEPFQAISSLQIWLLEQRDKPLTAQDESVLQSLQNVLLNNSRLAAKWNGLRLLIEPSTFAEKLRNTFSDVKDSLNQLQAPSKDNIVEQFDKVILNFNAGGDLSIELNRAETEFKHQFFDFLRENLSKSIVAEDIMLVHIWLAKQLGRDVDFIRHELEEIKLHGGTLIEGLIVYITELEERKHFTAELVAESCTEAGGESSDAAFDADPVAQPLDVVARNGVQALGLPKMARVLHGFANLIKCTKVPGGKLEVYKAGAIAEAVRLAKVADGQYTRQAMKLLEALTSSRGGVPVGSERDDIYIEVADHVEVLIELMRAKSHPEARLLAAKTVVNILVNEPVWHTVRSQYDIVSALVAISNEDPADRSIGELNQADRACLLGLSRLIEFSNGVNLKIYQTGDKTQIIVTILFKLLREGLMSDGEANLVKDTLVALDTQVLASTPTLKVGVLVREHIAELMKTQAFIAHPTVPGRMAIISILMKLCASYEGDITEDLFLYVFKMIKSAGYITMSLLDSGDEQVEDLAKLLCQSVKLLCFCVTHAKSTAQSLLSENADALATLEELLNEQDSGISVESRLAIMDVLDQLTTQPPTVVERVAKLVKMLDSSAAACRPQIANRILKCVKEVQREKDVIEIENAGVMDALMELSIEENELCQQDALLALYILSRNTIIQTGRLPCRIILDFLSSTRPEVREAAIGLLDLMVAEEAVDAKKFMETPGALKNTLVTLKDRSNWLDEGYQGPESASSRNSASALLKLATEFGDDSVRRGILNGGLGILIMYVQQCGNDKFKELLTLMLSLICGTGNNPDQEALTDRGGHIFLLSSLRGNVSKEAAAKGLRSLIIDNIVCRAAVLQAEFVTTAVSSVDQRFASTDIALGLAEICSKPEGMDQLHASTKSVMALLILLEHCPELEGKGAAADVISQLYPRLINKSDSHRQSELTGACPHLLRYLKLEDKSQLKTFLKALIVFATGRSGRQMIHEERGQSPLIESLKNKQFDNEVQGLMLKILAEMSYVFAEGNEKRDSSFYKIFNAFLAEKISDLLIILPELEEFNKNTENMKNLLVLIRNFSIAGPAAVNQLSEKRAVDLLLKVLKQHERETSLSILTELAVKALEKFMDEPSQRQAFMRGNGIESLVAVLKLRPSGGSDVNSFTTRILISVAKDPDTRRHACETIFSCDKDLLLSLTTILYDGETSRVKWQAAVLMKLLTMYGPTSKVCSALIRTGSLEALKQLRDVQHCKEISNDVLGFVKEKHKDCRKEIDSWSKPR